MGVLRYVSPFSESRMSMSCLPGDGLYSFLCRTRRIGQSETLPSVVSPILALLPSESAFSDLCLFFLDRSFDLYRSLILLYLI